MVARAACVALALAVAVPAAVRAETPIDVSDVKPKLRAFSDGKGHYLVLVPEGRGKEADLLYYGDGKKLYQQRVFSYAKEANVSFDYGFWEPRVTELWKSSFYLKKGRYELRCEDRLTEFKPVPEDESRKLIDAASFFAPLWERQAYALARDERGTYYYVDRAREPAGNRNFRLFVGPPGAMKPGRMKNIVSDSAGDIFSTPKGQLRLVLSNDEAFWIKGRKRMPLKLVPLFPNRKLIYEELGVYTGLPMGTPCDDL